MHFQIKVWVIAALSLLLFCCTPAFATTHINPTVKLYLPTAPKVEVEVTPWFRVHKSQTQYLKSVTHHYIIRHQGLRDTQVLPESSDKIFFDAPIKKPERMGIRQKSTRV